MLMRSACFSIFHYICSRNLICFFTSKLKLLNSPRFAALRTKINLNSFVFRPIPDDLDRVPDDSEPRSG